jgi:type I restriction-modification system DNA methylase subunit
VEIANKQFYDEIALKYTQLVGGERSGVQYPGDLKIESASEMPSGSAMIVEFAVRLIGRIIFCQFLCEVKSANGLPLMNADLFTKEAILDSDGNYYQNILVPLFFSVLNTKESDRHQKVTSDKRFAGIPYLNGGLFNPQIDDGFEDQKSNMVALYNVQIPNMWFLEFFDILNQYNFIVDENTSYDVELSIDPEMLGRIFENLLAEINPETGESARKSTGSFYTPREIVDYMVDSTLLEYLKAKTDISGEILENLITYNKNENLIELTYAEKESVINCLFSLSVLDPACGSGAFPIGVLQKVVYILQELDPNAEMWIDRVCRDATAFFKQEIKKKFGINALDYIRKLSVLQNSIFGVDIQPIAVEIARLRCFLSLVIEEKVLDNEPNRGILPLPNLDFKFISANTLVKLDAGEQISFFENQSSMNALNRVRYEYFNASDTTRSKLKNDFYDIQSTMLNEAAKNYQGLASRRHDQLSKWNPFENGTTNWFDARLSLGISSFDIVIANPPYVQMQNFRNEEVLEIIGNAKKPEYITYTGRTDIYVLFFERGLNLLKENGFLTYITSNKWMRASYGEPLRKYFVKNANPIRLIDLGGGRFKSATVDTSIIIIQKSMNRHKTMSIQYKESTLANISKHVSQNQTEIAFTGDEPWTILTPVEQKILEKIERVGTPLSEWNIKVNCGIVTGCNDAFVIDQATRDALVVQDQKSAEVIRPLLRGRDIKAYSYSWANLYMLYIPWHFPLNDDSTVVDVYQKAESAFKLQYPAIYNHLSKYKKKILAGDKTEEDLGHEWYVLHRYGGKSKDDLYKNKIIYREIGEFMDAVVDEKGYLINNKCYMVTGEYIKYLCSFFNSRLFGILMKKVNTLGGKGSDFICSIKAIKPDCPDRYFSDAEFFALYGLTDEEIIYLSESSQT